MALFWGDLKDFFGAYFSYWRGQLALNFAGFEKVKKRAALLLYGQRGRFSKPFGHFFLAFFLFLGIVITPSLEESLRGGGETTEDYYSPASVFAGSVGGEEETALTFESSRRMRSEVAEYIVREGDTIAAIAKKFGVSMDTVLWANNLTVTTKIKSGDRLKIPPLTGIVHKVQYGDTVYSLAQKYQVDAQTIVDFPFNSFANDETFAIAVGQSLVIPDGVMPKTKPVEPRAIARQDVKVAAGTGVFVWPTSGSVTQRFSWYHRAVDIANGGGPAVVASSGGRVVAANFSRVGYGNHIIIDHGNGYQTLYGHLAKIYVNLGDNVSSGQAIGQMGSTGRSTGVHLHFEIIKGGEKLDPLTALK